MGLGISRLNLASCGPFRRTSNELQDASTYKRLIVDNDQLNDNYASSTDSRPGSEGQQNSSSLPKKDVIRGNHSGQQNSSSLPQRDVTKDRQGQQNSSSLSKKDVVINEEKKSTYFNNINTYEEEDEDIGKISDYDGPMFMKSPSFRDFMRPINRSDDSVKNGTCKKLGEMRGNEKTEAHCPDSVCTAEVCMSVGKKNETAEVNKEDGPGKERRIYKIFSQYNKPSSVSGGMKSLFHVNYPKHPKDPSSSS